MENQFAVTVHEFFMAQDEQTRLGILEYYTHDPPNQMYLLWAASHDERLSTNARKASVILDTFFLSNKNNFISFELAHRQAAKLFKRKYLDRHVSQSDLCRRTCPRLVGRDSWHFGRRKGSPVKDKQCTVQEYGRTPEGTSKDD